MEFDGQILSVQYDPYYIFLSYSDSVLGSYVSITLIDQVLLSHTRTAFFTWLFFSALGLGGCSIFTMHFLGMHALSISTNADYHQIGYEAGYTILSLFLAIFSPFIGIYLVSVLMHKESVISTLPRIKAKFLKVIVISGLFTGLGIVLMHYTGMIAMKVNHATFSYNPGIIVLATVIAIFASIIALWIMFSLKGMVIRAGVSFILGAAVCAVHYVGMQGVIYRSKPSYELPNMGYLHGNVGLYTDIVSAIIRFLLLGLVYAKNQINTNILQDKYSKMRERLIEFDVVAATEFPAIRDLNINLKKSVAELFSLPRNSRVYPIAISFEDNNNNNLPLRTSSTELLNTYFNKPTGNSNILPSSTTPPHTQTNNDVVSELGEIVS